MKHYRNFHLRTLLLLFSVLINFSLSSCNQKKDHRDETTIEENPIGDTTLQVTKTDTLAGSSVINEPTPNQETPVATPAPQKKCDPNFNLIASPKRNQKIYYVSGFNPGEFKCWDQLVVHSQKICAGSPCIIYYVDKAALPVTSTPPHYLDANSLKTNGIGRYEYNGANWEIQGSSRWGRKGNGYAYYNTDNAGGG